MAEDLSKKSADFFTAGALIGQPVDDSGISRASVDGLDFSTEKEKRPDNMSREEYLSARPGEKTQIFMNYAGIQRRKKIIRVSMLVAVIAIGLSLYLWLT